MRWRPPRYTVGAWAYDRLAAEWVYRTGRLSAIKQMWLRPGDQVLDLGCGTGLNFPLLVDRVGSGGLVVGLDASQQMLAQARRRVRARGWPNVVLVHADATEVGAETLCSLFRLDGADGVLSTYALSIMGDWRRAWQTACRAARPGARMGVVDMRLPSGRGRPVRPLARLACALGGADADAHPWRGVEEDCTEVFRASLRGGHIQVRVGTLASYA
jgi:ubiquinone/menaquinone biosynthesis C-methylase UbiE